MSGWNQFRLELARLLKSRWTWLTIVMTMVSPVTTKFTVSVSVCIVARKLQQELPLLIFRITPTTFP